MTWREEAACKDYETAIFFPVQGGDHRTPQAICAGCPVQIACLTTALAMTPAPDGVWGGMGVKQRRRHARKHAIAPDACCDHCGQPYKRTARHGQRYCCDTCARAARRNSWAASSQRTRNG